MLPAPPSALLVLVLLQGSEVPLSGACEDIQRIDLSQSPTAAALEVCVSPRLMTGFTFDAPAVVELQDDVRFAEVMHGRSGLSIQATVRTIRASPCPPPPHSAAAPVPPPRRRNSCNSVSARRLPLIPIG